MNEDTTKVKAEELSKIEAEIKREKQLKFLKMMDDFFKSI